MTRDEAINTLANFKVYISGGGVTDKKANEAIDLAISTLVNLPSAQPEIIYCKDCRKHNVSVGYKKDCCALYEWRGISYGHEHDYQYCSHAERRVDELGDK